MLNAHEIAPPVSVGIRMAARVVVRFALNILGACEMLSGWIEWNNADACVSGLDAHSFSVG